MQESTQRNLCRLGFVVLALIPTILTISWSLWCMTPFSQMLTKSVWETHLTRTIGVSVQIDQICVIAPNRYRIRGLQLTHPETGKAIGNLERLELADSGEGGCDAWLVKVNGGHLSLDSLRYLVTQLHERCLCQPQQNYPRVSFVADDINIADGETILLRSIHWESQFDGSREQSILRCTASWKPFPDETNSINNAVINNGVLKTVQPLTLIANRQHSIVEPMTTWRVNSAGYSIPVALLSSLYGQPLAFGPNATVRGDFESKQTRYDWDLLISSIKVSDVKWDQVTAALPFRLLGSGGVTIEQAYIYNGQVHNADAIIELRNGSISRAWLANSQQDLSIRILEEVFTGAITMVPFEAMKARLTMDATGLEIRGEVPDVQGNVINSILADGSGGRVYEPESPKVGWSKVIRWLTNDPFDSTQFNNTSNSNSLSTIQQASHVVPNDGASNVERWLTTVLPSDKAIAQRR